MNLVDDATGITLAIMSEQETTEAAMRILWAWIDMYGIPLALYCDLKSVYLSDREPTLEEQLQGKLPKTAFGLACEKLGIEIISAYSPQAKGRVERKHGVYQDRFAKELRLKGAKTISEANLILKGGFIEKLNKRSVGHDWVVRNDNHFYQLIRGHEPLPRATTKVTVRIWLDGSVHILHRRRRVEYQEFDPQAKEGRKVI